RFAGTLDAEGAVKLLAGAEYSVCVRLHGAVFSVSAGTPAVCIAYDPKVSSFAKEMRLPCISTDELTPESVADAAESLAATDSVFKGLAEKASLRREKDVLSASELLK
ncbi:MAG: polysaccharide pyruvyl transferase family protein, partial [Clostridia bacterium]|nr:polysaccharide pyruvyl transferase family protein [Clostridia bacterium]